MTDRDTKPGNLVIEFSTRLEQLEQQLGFPGKGSFGDRLVIVETELNIFDRSVPIAMRLERCEVRAKRRHIHRVTARVGEQHAALEEAVEAHRQVSEHKLEAAREQAAMYLQLQSEIAAVPAATLAMIRADDAEQLQPAIEKAVEKALKPVVERSTGTIVAASIAAAAKITKSKWDRVLGAFCGAFAAGFVFELCVRIWKAVFK